MCVREGDTPGTWPVGDDEKIMLDEIERYLREARIAVMDMKNGFACRSEVMDKLGYLAGLVSRMVGMLDPGQEEARRRYVTEARKSKAVEGELEVDENAKISMGDPAQGAYVQAWVWLSAGDVYGNCPVCGHANLPEHICPETEQ